MGKSYSYVRVSTQHQNEDRQLLAMLEAGIAAEEFKRGGYPVCEKH